MTEEVGIYYGQCEDSFADRIEKEEVEELE